MTLAARINGDFSRSFCTYYAHITLKKNSFSIPSRLAPGPNCYAQGLVALNQCKLQLDLLKIFHIPVAQTCQVGSANHYSFGVIITLFFSSKSHSQPRWLSGLRRSRVHSLVIARRSLCPEKLGSNPGQGSKGINFSGWHGLDMSITVTKRR